MKKKREEFDDIMVMTKVFIFFIFISDNINIKLYYIQKTNNRTIQVVL
jgi:hypothetical protein